MYLIHVRMSTPHGFETTPRLGHLFLAHASTGEAVDHVSVHAQEPGALTVGLFVTADSLLKAENIALAVATRAVNGEPALDGLRVHGCSGALVGAFFDREQRTDGEGDGRTMQLPDQATEDY